MARDDLLVDPHGVLIPKGRLTNQHFVHKNAQGPPIHRCTMARIADDLWGKIFRGATKRVCHTSAMWIFTFRERLAFEWVRRRRKILRESKVDKLEVPVSVQQDVLGLEVSVGDVLYVMEVRKDQGNFGSIELDCRHRESTRTSEV
jgi:hypothetical protein